MKEEKKLQTKCIKQLKAEGWEVFKFNDNYRIGIPDTYLCKDGVSAWIEFKKPGGGKKSGPQIRNINKLNKKKIPARFVSSYEEFKEFKIKLETFIYINSLYNNYKVME